MTRTSVTFFPSIPDLVVLEDSEESASEPDDQDSKSITSLEDFSNLHPDMLLYKAAYARNLPVMLEALAQGANANWVNEDDDGKMPIMRAVESVSTRGGARISV